VEERRFSAASRIQEIRASAPVAPPGLKGHVRGDETRPWKGRSSTTSQDVSGKV